MRLCLRASGEHDEAGWWHVGLAAKVPQARGPGREGEGEEEGKLRLHSSLLYLRAREKWRKGAETKEGGGR